MFSNSFSNAPVKPGACEDAAPQRESRAIVSWLNWLAASATGSALVYFIASGIAHHGVYFIA